MTDTPALLDVRGLRKEYASARGPVVALDDITLSIPQKSSKQKSVLRSSMLAAP